MHGTWRSRTVILGLAAGLCAGGAQVAASAELPVAELLEIEQNLAQLNFDPGQIDGVVDDRTRTAIRLYQEFAVLPVDGEPSAKLLAELRQVSQAFAEMRAATPAEAGPAAAAAPEPEVAEPEPEVAMPEPEVAAPEPAEATPEPPMAAPEPEIAAPEPPVVAPEPPVAAPEPEIAASEPEVAVPELAPEPPVAALEAEVVAPAPEVVAPEPQVADTSTAESPEPAVSAPPQAPPAADAPMAELEPLPETAPAVETAKTEPGKLEPENTETDQAKSDPAQPGNAAGFSIESMIARLKQAGEPATPARPAPAQPPAPAPTPDGATGGASADPISADPTGATRTMIWKAQNELKRIGIDPGPADGNLRKRTTYAIQTYQRARGLPDDGRISEELLARLEAETAPATPAPSEAEPLGSVTLQSAAMTAVPQNGYQAFRAGYSAAQTGDFDAAIKLYDRAVDSGDLALEHLAAALYNRANALQYLGVLDKAIEDYSSAIANKPGFPAAYYNRGFAFDSKGEQIRAIEDYRKARDLGLQRLGVRSPDLPPPQF